MKLEDRSKDYYVVEDEAVVEVDTDEEEIAPSTLVDHAHNSEGLKI